MVLSVAALIAVRFSMRRGAQLPVAGGSPPAAALQPAASNSVSRVSRLLARFRDVLKRGGLWVAFGAGLGSGPAWHDAVLAISVSAASEAALGAQVSVVIVFLLIMLALVEIPLISYLVTPTKSGEFMLQLINWMRIHRRQILAVAGGGLVATSIGRAVPLRMACR